MTDVKKSSAQECPYCLSNLDALGQPIMQNIITMETDMSPEERAESFAEKADRAFDEWKYGDYDAAHGGPYGFAPWPGHDRKPDDINHPAHYVQGGIEVWDYLKIKLTPEELRGYCKGNILKYISRAKYKGDEEKDLDKAAWYAARLKETFK
jgi:hypothetical protein